MTSQFDSSSDEQSVVLASPRRQLIFYHIHESDQELTLEELSRKVARSEGDLTVRSVDDETVRRIYETLYITHIPVLIDHGFVEFDYEEGVVRATAKLDDFIDVTENERDERHRWFLFYLIPALILAGIVVAVNIGLIGESLPALVGVTIVGIVSLLVLSLSKFTDVSISLSRE